ncbi:MAG: hypothetical protein AUG74_21260 [Bacteroidetes bacterium 13_1_20CM_4_60_6]|nr:MAG: hypothetical protein AUG74_21260 [Bacteroidetes bacterium 13_1_20CM_4_60_6]
MEDNQTLFSLSIDPLTKAHLNDIAKWARFLGILAMVILFLALIFTILNATVLNNAMGMSLSLNGQPKDELSNSIRVSMVVGAIIMTGVAFIPLFFLLQFAGNMKKALAANDQDNLNEAFLI